MRARAIENGCFVFAAAQGGAHEDGRDTFGHSMVVDPWGRVVAEGGTEPGVILADIDPAQVATARARIPSLQHGRRFEVVEPIAEPAHLHVVRGRHDPLLAAMRERARVRKLVCELGGLRQAGQARAGDLPGMRLGQGREGDHGAALGAREEARARRCRRRSAAAQRRTARRETKAPVAMISPQEREFRQKLKELRDHLTQNADHVGAKFPEEARKMHYGEIEHRSIYGEASPEEAKELHEEGIEFHPLPVLPEERN